MRKLARGDLNGEASFAFIASKQEWSDDYKRREIHAATLHKGDVSVVDFGANSATSVGIDGAAPRAAGRRMTLLPDHTTAARQRLTALRWGGARGTR